ncbi:TauD/TfdA dioxygenase family protein [Sneathiella aquimaris]|uniref:TauD/TfdA dioxygenase family protein n=1 Tax=Sneathiella aquimaris TaxID=2599305 RepID=UPI001469D51F|nr:TauD/TfdA family dioxygenase [Sneathiella aquimaris]
MHDYLFSTERLGPVAGALVGGIDLATPFDQQLKDAVNRAFLRHKLLVFKNQNLSEPEQIQFSKQFGSLEIHVISQFNHPLYPEIFRLSNRKDANGNPLGAADGGSYWHSDLSYNECPAKATILHAKEIPDIRADTEFVDMQAAFEALPDNLREKIKDRFAIHAYRSNKSKDKGTSVTLSKTQLAATPEVVHPIVRTHPETGTRSIFSFPGIVQKIKGLTEKEGQPILDALYEHCLQDRFKFSLNWEKGDMAMWDNRCLMHRATTRTLPPDAYRVINRTTVSGDKPY